MKSVIKISKTVDQAVDLALKELQAKKEDVLVEIIEKPSKGLFGLIGTKDATVKVTVIYDPVEIAENFLNKMLSSMNLDGSSLVRKEDSCLYIEIININSSDMGIVIGKRGSTLDAIQFLVSLAVNKGRDDYTRVIVDAKGYRKRREQTLIRLANKMAAKAKTTKRLVKLEPMNPYERRIIHSALQDVNGITTFSEGEDPYRRVVIKIK